MADARSGPAGWAAWWGLAGVAILFASAVLRLGERGVITIQSGLSAAEWVALAALTAIFVYGEGVRALQGKYLPHLFGRLRALRAGAGPLSRVLAPAFALTLIGAPRRQLLRAWAGTMAIVAAVLVVRAFPEPWRGITDFAVAAALGWALIVLLARGPAALRGNFPTPKADIPGLVPDRRGY